MVVVKKHYLPPTKLVPNSKYPLLEYPGLFSGEQLRADKIFEKLASNGWEGQWVLRYAENQPAHYHSETHECMVVLHGSAKIRFGTADTSDDDEANRHGDGMEEGGLIVEVKPGDAFINPAGLSHKVFDSPPGSHFEILTPGGARKIDVENPHEALRELSEKLDGFVMLGGYPIGGRWNFNKGGEHEGDYESVWDVPKPAHDPFLGDAEEGLVGQWRFAGSGKKWHARHDSGRDEAIWDELQNNR